MGVHEVPRSQTPNEGGYSCVELAEERKGRGCHLLCAHLRTCLGWAREQLKVIIQAQLGWTGSNVTSSMQGVGCKCASQCPEAPPGLVPQVILSAGL